MSIGLLPYNDFRPSEVKTCGHMNQEKVNEFKTLACEAVLPFIALFLSNMLN